jgi:HEAT repeat protein
MIFFFIALVVVAIVLAVAGERKRVQQQTDAWRQLGRKLGLEVQVSEHQRSLSGVVRGVPLRVDFARQVVSTGDSVDVTYKTTFLAGGNGKIPGNLALRSDTLIRSVGRWLGGRDEELGDQRFDALVELQGLDARTCAALSSVARQRLAWLVDAGGEIKQGMVVCEVADDLGQDLKLLEQIVQAIAALGSELSVPSEQVPDRLAQNAQRDPSPEVRLKNFQFLLDSEVGTPRALLEATARALLADGHIPLRIMAARQLGLRAASALVALIRQAELEPGPRGEALRALGQSGSTELGSVVQEALNDASAELNCAALEVAAARQMSAFFEKIVELTRSELETVRAAAAAALRAFPGAATESALIALLGDRGVEVQQASAAALAEVGSVAAVEPLLQVAGASGRGPARQAARTAVARIQSRLGHVEAGRISLAEGQTFEGALTLVEPSAPVAGGEVSLAPGSARTMGLIARSAGDKPS